MTRSAPTTIAEIQETVRASDRVRLRGGGSKSALSANATLSIAALRGILQYEPGEYTFTALAGTPLAEIIAALDENRQFLPFDPPLIERQATLGGTVAAGLSGPGRFRYGGVRDFLLGVRVVTGEGRVVTGGGKVVKNAAGFDIPKLMVGSLGRWGVLVELTFKVFPRPEASCTLSVQTADRSSSVEQLTRLATSPLELSCLEFEPPRRLLLRVMGSAEALPARVERIRSCVYGKTESIPAPREQQVWDDLREFRWVPSDYTLIKLPLTPGQIETAESWLEGIEPAPIRRYSVGGNLMWLAWPREHSVEQLAELCRQLGRRALAVCGLWPQPLIGLSACDPFEQQLRSVFDPTDKFT